MKHSDRVIQEKRHIGAAFGRAADLVWQDKKTFFGGIAVASLLFFFFTSLYRMIWGIILFFYKTFTAPSQESSSHGMEYTSSIQQLRYYDQFHFKCHLTDFLMQYQPEIFATFIALLRTTGRPLESYFLLLEDQNNWPKFQKLMGNISLMVLEQMKVPSCSPAAEKRKEKIKEKYIPLLLEELRLLS